MGRVVKFMVAAMVVTSVGVTAPAEARPPEREGLVTVRGVKVEGGLGHVAEVVVEAADVASVGQALEDEGFQPAFNLYGIRWRRFFDKDRKNDMVDMLYNPAGETVPLAAALDTATATWSDVDTSTFGVRVAGTTDVRDAAVDFVNTISWPAVWQGSPTWIAFASLAFRTDTGFIVDADIEINSAYPFADPPVDDSTLDIRRVVLHELGHTAGIDHSFDPDAVMFASALPGPYPSGLGADDVAAISTLYPLDFDPLPKKEPKPPKPPKMFREVTQISMLGTILDDGSFLDDNFQVYDLNDAGTVAFAAGVFDAETFELGEGAFLADGTSFQPTTMARTGQPAPGGGTLGAGVWANIGLDAAGNAGFTHTLEPFSFPLGTNAGVYRYDNATDTLDAIAVPDGDPFVGAFTHTDVSPDGELVFNGITASGSGVYRADGTSAIAPVAVPGDARPGGGVFETAWLPSVNSAGDVAFTGHAADEADGVFLRRAGGAVQAIAREGDAAPGGGTFTFASHPVINERGDILFLAGFGDSGAGYFLWRNGKVVPVRGDRPGHAGRRGHARPGLPHRELGSRRQGQRRLLGGPRHRHARVRRVRHRPLHVEERQARIDRAHRNGDPRRRHGHEAGPAVLLQRGLQRRAAQ